MHSTETEQISIVLLAGNEIERRGAISLIGNNSQVNLLEATESDEQAIIACHHQKPDILLALTSSHCRRLARSLRRSLNKVSPQTKLMIVGSYEKTAAARATLKNGADGCLNKKCSSNSLIAALRKVNRGCSHQSDQQLEETESLTEREEQIVALVAEGYTNKEIGDILSLSKRTVEGYRKTINDKMSFKSRHQLVRYAFDSCLVSLD